LLFTRARWPRQPKIRPRTRTGIRPDPRVFFCARLLRNASGTSRIRVRMKHGTRHRHRAKMHKPGFTVTSHRGRARARPDAPMQTRVIRRSRSKPLFSSIHLREPTGASREFSPSAGVPTFRPVSATPLAGNDPPGLAPTDERTRS